MSDLKVILHLSEAGQWQAVLGNLANLTQPPAAAQVRVVINGNAVYTLQGQHDQLERLAQAQAAGVKVQVCHNSLRAHQIDPQHLPTWLEVVPNGVLALAQAQQEGWAYIRP